MRHRSGFSLIEVLVVMGISAILISLAMPLLSTSRGKAMGAKALSNIRQMATGLQLYADANADLPPVFGEPSWPTSGRWRFSFGEYGSGSWFEHQRMYSFAVTELLNNVDVAVAPGNPDPPMLRELNGVPVRSSDYFLTNALYADPAFFNWETQTGLNQMRPQRLSNVVFPSRKGLLWQVRMFHYPQYGFVLSCCSVDVPAPIAFADHSAAELNMRAMPAGMLNLFEDGGIVPGADPRTVHGTPVANTFDGVRGFDR